MLLSFLLPTQSITILQYYNTHILLTLLVVTFATSSGILLLAVGSVGVFTALRYGARLITLGSDSRT